jgi:LacI family transcriptional regulator
MAYLRDLATAANVSIRTVTRVLKNNGYVHDDTRQAVERAVRQLGYRPNLAARALKTAKSHLVSVLTFTSDELRMVQVAALEQRLRQAGYLVSMTFDFEFQQRAKAITIMQELISQRPAALALLGHDDFVAREILPALMPEVVRSGVPYIVIDPRQTEANYDAVLIDRSRGVYEAVLYLAEKGARRIAFLGTLEERTRLDGYEKAMKQLQRAPILIDFPGVESDPARALGREFGRRADRPDAVVVHSDYIALAFLAGLHDEGVRVPGEVALVGFDDRIAANLSWPRLTTVAQPSQAVGAAAAEILIRKIAGDLAPAGGWTRLFPTRLVRRETA